MKKGAEMPFFFTFHWQTGKLLSLKGWFFKYYVMTDLRKYLPRGYAKELAEKHFCSPDNIYKVASGKNYNLQVRLSILEMARKEIAARAECEVMEKKLTGRESHY